MVHIFKFGYKSINTRLIFEVVGLMVCAVGSLDSNSFQAEEFRSDENNENSKERLNDELNSSIRRWARASNILRIVLISVNAIISQHAPVVLFVLTLLEFISSVRVVKMKPLARPVHILAIVVNLVCIAPLLIEKSTWEYNLSLAISSLLICIEVMNQDLILKLTGSWNMFTSEGAQWIGWSRNGKSDGTRSPKLSLDSVVIYDKGWPFFVSIPLLMLVWGLGFLYSRIQSSVLGILAVISSAPILVIPNTIKVRLIFIRAVVCLISLVTLFLMISEVPSPGRGLKIAVGISSLVVFVFGPLRWYSDLMGFNSEELPKEVSLVTLIKSQSNLGHALSNLYLSAFPFASAIFIGIMAFSTLCFPYRLVLLALSALAAIAPKFLNGLVWQIITVYVVADQTILLFLTQSKLPVVFSPIQLDSAITNALVLLLAQLQIVHNLPSIFAKSTTSSEDVDEPIQYQESIYGRAFESGRIILNLSSGLVLTAVLIFYPQFTRITLQTSFYSLWMSLFAFLFYHSGDTYLMRLYFIRSLAASAVIFLIYNLWNFYYDSMSDLNAILYLDGSSNLSTEGRDFFLHVTVFLCSCVTLLSMQIQRQHERKMSSLALEKNEQELGKSSVKASPSSSFVTSLYNFMERVFILYWTRACALFAFLAAAYNPSLIGLGHIMIGFVLLWKNALNSRLYIPMILWVEVAIFVPAIIADTLPGMYSDIFKIVFGETRSFYGTIALTVWALLLLLQPLFVQLLEKLTSPKDLETSLVSFQLLPRKEEASRLNTASIESFEDSMRYYISNWFVEFHDELMISSLVVAAASRSNIFGVIYSILVLFHLLAQSEDQSVYFSGLSFAIQCLVFLTDYSIGLFYSRGLLKVDLAPGKLYRLAKFFSLPDYSFDTQSAQGILGSALLGALFAFLSVRWFITRKYLKNEAPKRRFDQHWCRVCDLPTIQHSEHAYSKVKLAIHFHLGWAANLALFLTSVTAYHSPTLPTVVLMIFALVFFFFGESSVLMPQLRQQTTYALGLIVSWIFLDTYLVFLWIFGDESIFKSSNMENTAKYLGLTSFIKFTKQSSMNVIFDSSISRASLFFAVALILLQIRIYNSKAMPFLLARLYKSFANANRKARIFFDKLFSTAEHQEKKLREIQGMVKTQMESSSFINISDWKKLAYQPPNEENSSDLEGKKESLPEYGENLSVDGEGFAEDLSSVNVRHRLATKFKGHLEQASTSDLSDNRTVKTDIEGCELHLEVLQSEHKSTTSNSDDAKGRLELEKNFYLYCFITFLRGTVKFLLNNSEWYRVIENRPGNKTSLKIIFHHNRISYRIRSALELLIDFVHANFDYVIDLLIMDANVYHSSAISCILGFGVLLVNHVQRPFGSKKLNSKLMVFCALWILFNFCKVLFDFSNNQGMKIDIENITDRVRAIVHLENYLSSIWWARLLGLHIVDSIAEVTLRPTLILLALSYKRSLMRHLGLWKYDRGMQMALAHYEMSPKNNDLDILDFERQSVVSEPYSLQALSEASSEDEIQNTSALDLIDDADEAKTFEPTTWSELFWPKVKMPWKDFYAVMFVADFTGLLLMMYYWGEFMLGPSTDIGGKGSNIFLQMLNQNMVPRSFVNAVLVNTFILVIDRVLYVRKMYSAKLLLQIATFFGCHYYVFFHLPSLYSKARLSSLFGVKLWYLCKWIYWISSSLQMRFDYAPLRLETFMASEFGMTGMYLHMFYRQIPFIEELKIIIDWSVSSSSLGLWPWLKLADIFERLYAIKCARVFQQSYFGRHQFGVAFGNFNKYVQGIVIVFLSIYILWSPFILVSSPSMMTPNDVQTFKLKIGFPNQSSSFLSFTVNDFKPPSDRDYETLRHKPGVNPIEVDPTYFTKVILSDSSQKTFSLTQAALEDLMDYLNYSVEPKIMVTWSISRKASQPFQEVKGSHEVMIEDDWRNKLIQMFNPNHKLSFQMIKIPMLLPFLVKGSLTQNSTALAIPKQSVFSLLKICPSERTRLNIYTIFRGLRRKERIQSLKDKSKAAGNPFRVKESSECYFALGDTGSKKLEPVSLFVYSPKLPVYNYSSFNLVGLYATVVLYVHQFMKMMHADMTTRIPYDELPNPSPLLIMYQQLLVMRELGDFVNEEAIYWQLIEIFRNPQLLHEMTKT